MTDRLRPALLLPALLGVALLPLAATDSVLTVAIHLFHVAALAASWNILAGFTGQISLGHAAFFGVGALVARALWLGQGAVEIVARGGAPFPVAFVLGGAAAGVVALVVGAPALRLRAVTFAIATLALAEAARITVGNSLPTVTALPAAALRGYGLTSRYLLALGVLLLTLAVAALLCRSRLGLAMDAVRQDEAAARAVGINAFRLKLLAFVLSATLAGLAGGSFAYFHVSYYPTLPFSPEWTFDALVVTFVGGVGTLAGPILGAAFFVLAQELLAGSFPGLHLLLFGVLFIAVVLAAPGGLMALQARLRARLGARQ